jgi:DNA-binding protein H-NS
MAKGNERLTANTVGEWFSVMGLSEQAVVLGKLEGIHRKVRQVRIDSLKRELSLLENGSGNGRAAPRRGPTKRGLKVKYRDPKSGETWSGRGRMARWLAEKVKAGDKQEKYLA